MRDEEQIRLILALYSRYNDYKDEEEFWAQVERAAETARGVARRMRAGDVTHDPRWGECPSWCELYPMCRVKRA